MVHQFLTITLAFDEFTAENGATGVIPGSHTWGPEREPKYEDTIPMSCPAGSAVFFISTTWHHGGANKSTAPRKSATVQYCQPYVCGYLSCLLFAVVNT